MLIKQWRNREYDFYNVCAFINACVLYVRFSRDWGVVMEYIVVLIPVLLIVIMGWHDNDGKGGYFQGDMILGNKRDKK